MRERGTLGAGHEGEWNAYRASAKVISILWKYFRLQLWISAGGVVAGISSSFDREGSGGILEGNGQSCYPVDGKSIAAIGSGGGPDKPRAPVSQENLCGGVAGCSPETPDRRGEGEDGSCRRGEVGVL